MPPNRPLTHLSLQRTGRYDRRDPVRLLSLRERRTLPRVFFETSSPDLSLGRPLAISLATLPIWDARDVGDRIRSASG